MKFAKICVPFQKLWTEKQQRAMGWVHKMKVWVRAMRDHGRILFLTSFLRELNEGLPRVLGWQKLVLIAIKKHAKKLIRGLNDL